MKSTHVTLKQADEAAEDAPPETAIRRWRRDILDGYLGPPSIDNGSELALMAKRHQMTATEFDAAKWFRNLSDRYASAIDSKALRGQSFEVGLGGHPPDPDSDAGASQARREARVISEYDAVVIMLKGCPREAMMAFEAVVFRDECPNWYMRTGTKRVAHALANHRDQRGRKKPRR